MISNETSQKTDFNPFERDPQYFEKPDVRFFSRVYRATVSLAAAPKILIVDLSHWNGDIDPDALIASGVVAVIIKCSEGAEGTYYEFKDPKFEENWRKCLDAGLIVMVYHFNRGYKGSAEKSWFMKCADNFLNDERINGNTAVWLDCEWKPTDMTVEQYANRSFGFCSLIEGEGFRQGIYSSPGLVPQLFPASESRWDKVWQWNAHWTDAAADTLPRGWSQARRKVWQFGIYPTYDWTPVVNGAGTVDVNWGYWVDANDLRSWLGQVITPPPDEHEHPDLQAQIDALKDDVLSIRTKDVEQDTSISLSESDIVEIRNRLQSASDELDYGE